MPKAETQEHGVNWQLLFLKNVTGGGRMALSLLAHSPAIRGLVQKAGDQIHVSF